MVAVKSVGWGAVLAVAGLALGFVFALVFPSTACCGGFGPLMTMVLGFVMGATVGVVAPLVAAAGAGRERDDDHRSFALALVVPPVVLGAAAAAEYGLHLGIDIVPAAVLIGAIAGIATGLAWGYARRQRLRVTPTGALVVTAPLLATAWLLGTALGFDAGGEDVFAPGVFLYLSLILPLQLAAPVSTACSARVALARLDAWPIAGYRPTVKVSL